MVNDINIYYQEYELMSDCGEAFGTLSIHVSECVHYGLGMILLQIF